MVVGNVVGITVTTTVAVAFRRPKDEAAEATLATYASKETWDENIATSVTLGPVLVVFVPLVEQKSMNWANLGST